MAIYHLSVKIGSKDKGHSAQQKCAYITRTEHYAKKAKDCSYAASGNMPTWPKRNPAKDPAVYWEMADFYERDNGRLFREVEFALPKELTLDQQKALCHEFAELLTSLEMGQKLPYTFAIHTDANNHNPHCHLMISERVNDGVKRNASSWFKRANPKEPKKGGALKTQALNGKTWLLDTRQLWANLANEALKKADPNHSPIDHRSLKDQGILRLPTQHLGARCTQMMDRKVRCERGEQVRKNNLHARKFNAKIPTFQAKFQKPPKTIEDVMRALERVTEDHLEHAKRMLQYEEERLRQVQEEIDRRETEAREEQSSLMRLAPVRLETGFVPAKAWKPTPPSPYTKKPAKRP